MRPPRWFDGHRGAFLGEAIMAFGSARVFREWHGHRRGGARRGLVAADAEGRWAVGRRSAG